MRPPDWSIFKSIINQDLKLGSDRVFNSDHDSRKNTSFSSIFGHFLDPLNLEFGENIYRHLIGQF